jgi:hypothetical protein
MMNWWRKRVRSDDPEKEQSAPTPERELRSLTVEYRMQGPHYWVATSPQLDHFSVSGPDMMSVRAAAMKEVKPWLGSEAEIIERWPDTGIMGAMRMPSELSLQVNAKRVISAGKCTD